MGTCVSAVLGTPRKWKGRTPQDDSDNKELTGEVNGEELPECVNSEYRPDNVHSKLPPNGIHLPDEEHNNRVLVDAHNEHLPDDVHDKTKRRALLVGITYPTSNTWSQLDGPHDDVDQYRDLLISACSRTSSIRFPLTLADTYGYRPKDIVVLKDPPEFPQQYKPTQVNMVRP